MSYLGDFNQNQTVHLPFPSTNANGTPTALANGTVVVYKNANLTEATANITLNTSLDSRAGVNLITIDMSANTTFYASGNNFFAVLSVGDVSGTSVANMTLGSWSVNNRAGSTTGQIANSTTTGSGLMQTITLNVPSTGARVTPPSSSTSLTTLLAASPTNLSLSNDTMRLWLQAENGTIRYTVDGSNASQSSRLIATGSSVMLQRENKNINWFTSINVAQDSGNAANATLRVDPS